MRRLNSYLARTALLVLHVSHDALESIAWIRRVVRPSIIKVFNLLKLGEDCFRGKFDVDWEAMAT